jgi:hypothetical protein
VAPLRSIGQRRSTGTPPGAATHVRARRGGRDRRAAPPSGRRGSWISARFYEEPICRESALTGAPLAPPGKEGAPPKEGSSVVSSSPPALASHPCLRTTMASALPRLSTAFPERRARQRTLLQIGRTGRADGDGRPVGRQIHGATVMASLCAGARMSFVADGRGARLQRLLTLLETVVCKGEEKHCGGEAKPNLPSKFASRWT